MSKSCKNMVVRKKTSSCLLCLSLDWIFFFLINESEFLTSQFSGFLSLLGIGTKDGSAEKDKDFRGRAQKQVQFNPGQTTATWRVKIFTDQEFETSETFEIQLSDPVMAVLEYPDAATVEIVDPGDGRNVMLEMTFIL